MYSYIYFFDILQAMFNSGFIKIVDCTSDNQ